MAEMKPRKHLDLEGQDGGALRLRERPHPLDRELGVCARLRGEPGDGLFPLRLRQLETLDRHPIELFREPPQRRVALRLDHRQDGLDRGLERRRVARGVAAGCLHITDRPAQLGFQGAHRALDQMCL